MIRTHARTQPPPACLPAYRDEHVGDALLLELLRKGPEVVEHALLVLPHPVVHALRVAKERAAAQDRGEVEDDEALEAGAHDVGEEVLGQPRRQIPKVVLQNGAEIGVDVEVEVEVEGSVNPRGARLS